MPPIRPSRRLPRAAIAALAALLPLAAAASDSDGASAAARSETVSLRVQVDAAGRVAASEPMHAAAVLNAQAQAFARLLVFVPARKQGVAVPSQTCLNLQIAIEPRADGKMGVRLKRAVSNPCVAKLGKLEVDVGRRENGGLVVVGATLRPDGSVDMDSLATEKMELRTPSSFAEARYLDAIRTSLRGSRFELDHVAGEPVTAQVSLPYQFGGGAKKPGRGEGRRGGPPEAQDAAELPSWNPRSTVPGVELPRIDYRPAA